MQRIALFAPYVWLLFTGVMHFSIDVLSQHLRGRRAPSPETTLYYGLHSSFALGQVGFGALALWLASRDRALLSAAPLTVISLALAAGWFAITMRFMEYWEPKFNVAVFAALLVFAAWMARR